MIGVHRNSYWVASMSIYDPITRFLEGRSESAVPISFEELEKLIGRPLPRSAYERPEWWSNNTTGHSHARAWARAGWRTEKVDLKNKSLVFSRSAQRAKNPDPFGIMRGSVVFAPGFDPTEPTGELWEAEQGPERG